jgi:hypothetical protein
LVEEEVSEAYESTETASTVEEEGGEEEEISVSAAALEAMLERLAVIEKLARGEMSPEEAAQVLSKIRMPELEKKKRRRRR